jgi:hypothetical protein
MFSNPRMITGLLGLIAFFLGIIALRPLAAPTVAWAQSDHTSLYVEPGTTLIRNPDGLQQVEGKVVIDLKSGDIWGFPTLSGTPYPVDTTRSTPPISDPIYLGKFDLSKMVARKK